MGGVDDLRLTRISDKVTESQCLGVVDPMTNDAYGAAPVRAVTYGTESAVTFGVVALRADHDAQALFATFVDQWRRCDGKTVVDNADTPTDYQITDVKATNDMLSAVVILRNKVNGTTLPTERALGFSRDCIVDVDVPVTAAGPADTGGSPQNAATRLVNLMLDKVRTGRRQLGNQPVGNNGCRG